MNQNMKVGAGDPGQIITEASADPPPAPQGLPVRKKVYRMESDIFGTGMNSVTGTRYSCPAKATNAVDQLTERLGRFGFTEDPTTMVPAGMPSPSTNVNRNVVLGRGMVEDPCPEPRFEANGTAGKRNARENGGNPLTGEGYANDEPTQSQRRQYRRYKSTPLW